MSTTKEKPKMPTPEELEAMMVVSAWLVHGGVFVLQFIIYGLPFTLCALPFFYVQSTAVKLLLFAASPLAYAFLFAVTAGILSLPWQAGIVKGVFPRDVRFPIYAMRKLYGTCWTALYYFKPVYTIILNVYYIKAIVFRLFGYRGSLDFTIFPDAWIRDLTLLKIEEGAYIANRSTMGTNICTLDGWAKTGNITLMKGSMIGHRATVGLGLRLGEKSEVGVECSLGIHIKIGNESVVGAASGISHGAKIGNNTQIGVRCFVGTGAIIGDNLNIPSNTQIPDGAIVNTQDDVLKYVNQATETIQ